MERHQLHPSGDNGKELPAVRREGQARPSRQERTGEGPPEHISPWYVRPTYGARKSQPDGRLKRFVN